MLPKLQKRLLQEILILSFVLGASAKVWLAAFRLRIPES